MSFNRERLEELPHSPYAAELLRRPRPLRFDAPLEAEYRAQHVRRVRLRVRAWHTLNLALTLFFTLDLGLRSGIWNLLFLAHAGLLLPVSITLVWLAWSPRFERLYLPAGRLLVPLFSGLIAAFAAIAIAGGREELLAALAVVLLAAFFFAGLLFYEALLTSAIMLVAFAVTALAAGVATALAIKSMVILTVTLLIGAIVNRDIEKSYRRTFLESALVRELAVRDELSGLMNRRAFDEHLLRVWQHALRENRPLAVLMIDVDHFKPFNDEFGHQAGDAALRAVAKAIQDFARRPLDIAARYGGEEFAVILYDLAFPNLQVVAEGIREAVQKLEIRGSGADAAILRQVTVSVGVGSAVPSMGRVPAGVVQLADEALYEAKRAGRNCVIVKGKEDYLRLDTGAFRGRQHAQR